MTMKTLRGVVAGGFFGAMCVGAVSSADAGAAVASQPAAANAPVVPREPRVHDPSMIIKEEGGDYWFFCTGNGVSAWRSRDLATWERERPVFETMPAWHREVVPEQKGHLWAPDVIKGTDGRYWFYYSVSSFGVNMSAIGLATAVTLDPASPEYGWRDEGIVVRSEKADKFNAIDPAIFRDEDGRLWMSFGSFWSGLKLIELDAKTGKRLTDGPMFSIAWKEEIEAPAIHKRDGWYYLFVNWGICCRGADSTYEIRVGRSREITGPYVDREGVELMKGGGTKFLATEGAMIGPGHVGIFAEGGREWLGIHFYDGADKGRPTFALRELGWGEDGWPVAGAVKATRLLSTRQTPGPVAP